jgi:hypothetical protein
MTANEKLAELISKSQCRGELTVEFRYRSVVEQDGGRVETELSAPTVAGLLLLIEATK